MGAARGYRDPGSLIFGEQVTRGGFGGALCMVMREIKATAK